MYLFNKHLLSNYCVSGTIRDTRNNSDDKSRHSLRSALSCFWKIGRSHSRKATVISMFNSTLLSHSSLRASNQGRMEVVISIGAGTLPFLCYAHCSKCFYMCMSCNPLQLTWGVCIICYPHPIDERTKAQVRESVQVT